MSNIDYTALDCCPAFANLSKNEKQDLIKVCHKKRFNTKEILFAQGSCAQGFYIIVSGAISVYRLGTGGKEQLLHVLGEGELCGEVPVFQGGLYPANARADILSEVLYVPGDDFLTLSENHPEILLDILAVLSMRLRKFVDLIDDLSLKEVSSRLAKFLIEEATHQNSDSLTLNMSKAKLAAQLGTIAETISRTFSRMSKKAIITVNGKNVTILDKAQLANLADGGKL